MALRENRSNRSYIWLAVALLIFMVLVAYYARSYRVLQDDAYISLRYADNLVHGHGLTFNVGDRVEGYSNFLWVILMAGAVKLGIHPVAFVKVVGVLSGLLLVLAVWRFSEDFSQLPPRLRVAAPLVAVAGPVAFAAIGGLETGLFALLVFLGAYRYLREAADSRLAPVSALAFLMAALVRVDGFLFFLLTMVHLGATRIVRREPLGRRELAYVLVFGVPFLAYWVWRTEYYGYLLPNTFYAKTSFSLDYLLRGVKYLVEFLPLYGGALLILVPFLLLNDSRWRSHSYLLALIAGWSAYTVWIGGDGLVMFRFAVPIIAPLAYLLQEGLGLALSVDGSPARSSWLPVARPALQVCAALGVLAVVGLGWLHSAPVSAMKSNAQLDQARVRLGQWLQQEALSGDSLAVGAAGAMPYYSGLPTVDMLGLNDVHIAHEGKRAADSGAGHDRFDAEYVLRQQPTFIVLGPMFEDGSNLQEATIPAVKAILESEGFCRQYQRLAVPSLGRHEVVFVRLDRVSALRGVEVVRDCSYATTRAPTAVAQGPVP